MIKMCELCKGNDHIKIRQVWKDTEEKQKVIAYNHILRRE